MILYTLFDVLKLKKKTTKKWNKPISLYIIKQGTKNVVTFKLVLKSEILYYCVVIERKSLFLPSCWHGGLSVLVPYRARHSIFLTVCAWRNNIHCVDSGTHWKQTTLWMGISGSDLDVWHKFQRAGSQQCIKVTLFSKWKTKKKQPFCVALYYSKGNIVCITPKLQRAVAGFIQLLCFEKLDL